MIYVPLHVRSHSTCKHRHLSHGHQRCLAAGVLALLLGTCGVWALLARGLWCHHCLLGVRACVSSTGCFELVVCQHWLLGACVCQHCLLLSLRVSMEHCAAGRQLSNCPASWSACLEHICRQHFVEVCTDMEAGRFRLLCMFCCGCVEPMIPCALRCHCALTNCYS